MASLGNGSLTTAPTQLESSGYTPYSGGAIGSASLVETGGGGEPVDPKRYLRVGGEWIPIQ